ncbi:MAG: beta-propeller domain-containing protein [Deltaproteobacteria bacterium]|nr:beta-propeller domain-containing protein [Deltaproteobacteria bacterium]
MRHSTSLLVLLALFTVHCGGPMLASPSQKLGTADVDASGEALPQATLPDASPTTNASPSADAAARALAEADIIQLHDGRLYVMSKAGSLSLIDTSIDGALTLLGQAQLIGQPFEMYRRDGFLVVMAKAGESTITIFDVRDPTKPTVVMKRDVAGQVSDSRVLGDVLYVATYTSDSARVTSFAIKDPAAIAQVAELEFAAGKVMSTQRAMVMNTERLYLGGDAPLSQASDAQMSQQGVIDVVDVSDPGGAMKALAKVNVHGGIRNRWQLDERAGVLRVVSQRGSAGSNGDGAPKVETFAIVSDPQQTTFNLLGELSLKLPRQEGLRAVRFDGDRAYAITFMQTDPLFVLDLADPAAPKQRGELALPGYIYHIVPFADRLVALGVDSTDAEGSLNVSLIDVANADAPALKKRVGFATPHVTNVSATQGELPEDQDRIQKAFRIFESGRVVVPFRTLSDWQCANDGGGVQVIDWKDDTLTKKVLLPLPGSPRRAFELQSALIGVSDSHVRAYAFATMDTATVNASLEIDTCVPPHAFVTPAPQPRASGPSAYGGPDTRSNDYGVNWRGNSNKAAAPASSQPGPVRANGCAATPANEAWLIVIAAAFVLRRRRVTRR